MPVVVDATFTSRGSLAHNVISSLGATSNSSPAVSGDRVQEASENATAHRAKRRFVTDFDSSRQEPTTPSRLPESRGPAWTPMRAASRIRKGNAFLASSLEPHFVGADRDAKGSRRIRANVADAARGPRDDDRQG